MTPPTRTYSWVELGRVPVDGGFLRVQLRSDGRVILDRDQQTVVAILHRDRLEPLLMALHKAEIQPLPGSPRRWLLRRLGWFH